MKKIFFLLLALITFHFTSIAQCPQASAEVLTTHHGEINTSGAYNSFGVRITLNQVNSEDVTVTGVVFETENQSISANFSMTVNAGYLTAEADDLLTAGRDSYAAVTINSVSPCPYNPNNSYDYVGQQHNAILDYVYDNMSLPANSEDDIFDIVAAYYITQNIDTIASFFNSTKGTIHEFQTVTNICSTFSAKGFSSGFNNYYNSIDGLIDNASSPEDFYASMISLEQEINNSTLISSEKAILLSSAAVYRYSAYYWSTEGRIEDWEAKFGQIAYIDEAKNFRAIHESGPFYNYNLHLTLPYFTWWKDALKADGHGAIQGGVAGFIVGGLYTGIAGAVTWGAGCSVDNLATHLWHWLF